MGALATNIAKKDPPGADAVGTRFDLIIIDSDGVLVNSERGTIVALIDTKTSASVGRADGKNYIMSPMNGSAVDPN